MFGISLKKSARVSARVATVEEIHQAFDDASDEIIQEANAILAKQASEDDEIYLKLGQIGFNKNITIQALQLRQENRDKAKRTSDYHNKYTKIFPNYSFITEDKLQSICKKYGLAYSEAENFLGEIPKQNAKDIIEFEQKFREMYPPQSSVFSPARWSYGNGNFSGNFLVVASANMFSERVRRHYNPETGQMRAPDQDPVVLFSVSGGFLILTKWGAEADIEEFNTTNQQPNK